MLEVPLEATDVSIAFKERILHCNEHD